MDRLCDRLRLLRREKELKQTEMAKELGVSIRTYQYYESGEHVPDYYGLLAMADYFAVSLDYLTGRGDER